MNDKQQLSAMGEHLAEQQPMCMAKRIEELEAQVRVMGSLLNEAKEDLESEWSLSHSLRDRIDAALAGKVTVPVVEVTETIRTAPARIWLQVGDQSHYHSEPFPSDTGDVTWCADSVVGCEVPYVRADLIGRSPAVPEGWRMVQVEATDDMLEMAEQAIAATGGLPEVWVEMLAAAPKPDVQQ